MGHTFFGQHLYLSVAGNIGVGKNTLVETLAAAFGWQPYYEFVADHPYLDDFYADKHRWGFHSQMWFLAQRFEQQREIADTPISLIQDRSIYEDYEVFAKGLLEQGIMSHRDFRTYRKLYQALIQSTTPPTLMVYLRGSVPTLLERIKKRARPSEMNISADYLSHLNNRYDEWLRRFELCPVLTIETDDLDVVNRDDHRQQVIEIIGQAVGRRSNFQYRLPLNGDKA